LDVICAQGTGDLYDYSFETLCYEAFGGRWIGSMSLDARPEDPQGFGPLPNTRIYAQVFNRLSSAWNLLDKARLDFPYLLEAREVRYEDANNTIYVPPTAGTCGGTWFAKNVTGPAGAEGAPSAWSTVTSVTSDVFCGPDGTCDSGNAAVVLDRRWHQDWRITPNDPDWIYAVPDALRSHLENGGAGIVAEYEEALYREQVVAGGPTNECGADWTIGGADYEWVADPTLQVSRCELMVGAGRLDCGPPQQCDVGRMASGCPHGFGRYTSLTPLVGQVGFVQIPIVEES
jgi:hypothetical protein